MEFKESFIEFYSEIETNIINEHSDFHIKFTFSMMSKIDLIAFMYWMLVTKPDTENLKAIIEQYLDYATKRQPLKEPNAQPGQTVNKTP